MILNLHFLNSQSEIDSLKQTHESEIHELSESHEAKLLRLEERISNQDLSGDERLDAVVKEVIIGLIGSFQAPILENNVYSIVSFFALLFFRFLAWLSRSRAQIHQGWSLQS